MTVRDGRINQVFTNEQTPKGVSEQETIDLKGAYLAPGMIDIHIHGSVGVDVLNADRTAWRSSQSFWPRKG